MGCGGSKLDDLEAVTLCRDRTRLLADAIRHRYALAEAHAAYARALRSTGGSLHRFLDAFNAVPPPKDSPFLPLPPHRKSDPLPPPAATAAPAAVSHRHSHSQSSSHIQFHSDTDSSDSSPTHSDHHEEPPGAGASATSYNYSYARSTPAAPVAYERRPEHPETVQFGAGEAPSYHGYPYPAQSSSLYSHPYPNYAGGGYFPASAYPTHNVPPYSGAGGGFFSGSSYPPVNVPAYSAAGGAAAGSSTSWSAPPPPSPPRASTWDFLDPFHSYRNYEENNVHYGSYYTPSRTSREVREEEGIPDLEDEEDVVMKEIHGEQRLSASTSFASSAESASKMAGVEEGIEGDGEELHCKPRKSAEASSSVPVPEPELEPVAELVDKNVVADEVKLQEEVQLQDAGTIAVPRKYHDLTEVMQEITEQFDKASGSFDEVSKIFEVGKIHYSQKNTVYEVSTRMICGMTAPSTFQNELLEFAEANLVDSGSLSSTLQKLYIWEEKLYHEVKVEEKMRIVLERECERLRWLDEKGSEAHKLEATGNLIKKLSTKIRIAIQVVESISNNINKLRDEELWPQISELIQELMRMWKVMLQCHRTQYQAISDATIASNGMLSDAHMEMTKELELELLALMACFSVWVRTQKSFVKSLNCWLLKGLHYVPEKTPDGFPPFSPGRLGAPPLVIICNYWYRSIDRISEKEVVNALQAFASDILGLWEQHKFEQHQRLMENTDRDRTLRVLEREELEMRRAVEAQNKKLVVVFGQDGLTLSGQVHHVHTAELSRLPLNLRRIFEAMESFTATSAKAYEELCSHAEDEGLEKNNSRVS